MPHILFIGTYTRNLGFVDGHAGGIHVLLLDETSPESLTVVQQDVFAGDGPSYLALLSSSVAPSASHGKEAVFRVIACQEGDGDGDSAVGFMRHIAVRVSSVSGLWTADAVSGDVAHDEAHLVDVKGACPCHIAMSPCGHWLCCATYMGGAVSLHRVTRTVDVNGAVTAVHVSSRPSDVQRHVDGSGVDPQRQEASHAHHCLFVDAPNGTLLVLVCDLGADCVWVFELDKARDVLVPLNMSSGSSCLKLPAGAGPRHALQHVDGNGRICIFVVCELSLTLAGFRMATDTQQGLGFEPLFEKPLDLTDPSHPQRVDSESKPLAGGIAKDASGQLVFVSIRGLGSSADYVTVVDVRRRDVPRVVGFIHGVGVCPRDIQVLPSANGDAAREMVAGLLVVAGQDGDTVRVIRWSCQGHSSSSSTSPTSASSTDAPHLSDAPFSLHYSLTGEVRCPSPAAVLPVACF